MHTYAVEIVYRGYLDDPSLAPARYEFVVLAAQDLNSARAAAVELAAHRDLEHVVDLEHGEGALEFIGIRSICKVKLVPPEAPTLVGFVEVEDVDWHVVIDELGPLRDRTPSVAITVESASEGS